MYEHYCHQHESEGVSEAKVQREVVQQADGADGENTKLFEIHNGQRALFLKTSLGLFSDILAGLITPKICRKWPFSGKILPVVRTNIVHVLVEAN